MPVERSCQTFAGRPWLRHRSGPPVSWQWRQIVLLSISRHGGHHRQVAETRQKDLLFVAGVGKSDGLLLLQQLVDSGEIALLVMG